jgi:hypothetical protein
MVAAVCIVPYIFTRCLEGLTRPADVPPEAKVPADGASEPVVG